MATKKTAGRPPKPIDYALVERLAGVGFSVRQIATVIDMNEEHIHVRAQTDQQLSHALSGAKDRMHSRLVGEIVQFALDSSIPYAQRRKDITFLLSRRFGWTEKVHIEQAGPQLIEDISFLEATDIKAEE